METKSADLLKAAEYLEGDGVSMEAAEADRIASVLRAMAAGAVEPVAEVESYTNGSYSRNYKLRWLRDVPEGAKLYAHPAQAEAVQPISDADIEKAWRSCGTLPDGGNLAGGTNLAGWRNAVRWAEQQHGIASPSPSAKTGGREVYEAMSDDAKKRTSPENVADVLAALSDSGHDGREAGESEPNSPAVDKAIARFHAKRAELEFKEFADFVMVHNVDQPVPWAIAEMFVSRFRAALAAHPAAAQAEPLSHVTEADMAAMEKWIAERHGNAAFFPADAHHLANITALMIREVRQSRAAAAPAPAAATAQEWMPIESAPEDTNVLVATKGGFVDTAFWTEEDGEGRKWWWLVSANEHAKHPLHPNLEPTYWMPLPKHPEVA